MTSLADVELELLQLVAKVRHHLLDEMAECFLFIHLMDHI
jgi:hypothetical protein